MPSIPRFHVTQDATFVFVHVNVPYVRVSEMEFHVEGTQFTFYCKPYLLKLQFPHEVEDNERAKGVYDPNEEHGTIVVHLPKAVAGQHFEDLDLLTKLLQPKRSPSVVDLQTRAAPAPLIQVLDSSIDEAAEDEGASPLDHGTTTTTTTPVATAPTNATLDGDASLLDLERRFQEATADEQAPAIHVTTELRPRYGFLNAYTDVFRGWHSDTSEILSLPAPDTTPAPQRRVLRLAGEDQHFNMERYLMDYAHAAEDSYYALAMAYVPSWHNAPVVDADSLTQQLSQLEIASDPASSSPFSPSPPPQSSLLDEDRELLQQLPNKEFLVASGSAEEALALGSLADILVGYVYDALTTQEDSGIESTWTVSILSPSLSWLDPSADLHEVVRASMRRMLAFPFLRQYALAQHVLLETAALLRRGKRVVLHHMLALHRVVAKSETQYLLNTLFVQDYCIWLQTVSDATLARCGRELEAAARAFRKSDTGWALREMERELMGEVEEEDDEEESSEEESSEEEESSDEESSDEEEEEESGGEGKEKTEKKEQQK